MNYTTVKQSNHLLELGLSPNTADMCYLEDIVEGNGCIPWCKSWSKYPVCVGDKPECDVPEPVSLPCWSEGALDEVIKTCERCEIHLRVDKRWNIFATNNGRVFQSYNTNPNGFETKMDGLYRLVCWILENEH